MRAYNRTIYNRENLSLVWCQMFKSQFFENNIDEIIVN